MLSELERTRLETRKSLDKKKRATNDARVKKKLINWLIDSHDVIDIIQHIPEERLKNMLVDADVYRLMHISIYLMKILRFMQVTGDLDKPEKWLAEGYGVSRPVDNTDIGRVFIMQPFIEDVEAYRGGKNPVLSGIEWSRIVQRIGQNPDDMDKRILEMFTPEMKNGVRTAQEMALKYSEELTEKLKAYKTK